MTHHRLVVEENEFDDGLLGEVEGDFACVACVDLELCFFGNPIDLKEIWGFFIVILQIRFLAMRASLADNEVNERLPDDLLVLEQNAIGEVVDQVIMILEDRGVNFQSFSVDRTEDDPLFQNTFAILNWEAVSQLCEVLI